MVKFIVLSQEIDEDSTVNLPQNAFPLAVIQAPTGGMVMFAMTIEEYQKQLASDPEFAESFKPKG